MILVIALGALGCAPVRPWERGTLAHRCMRADDAPRVDARKWELHVLWAREASVGAAGEAGGGCGCN
ncbi:MAG: DUF4266 domain-containing protein [Myxococcota bacterium]